MMIIYRTELFSRRFHSRLAIAVQLFCRELADKVEMLKEHRFLSSKIGFSAANLLELFLEVEKEFGITFSKDEILSTQFDDYTELVEGISKKLGGE